MSQTISKKIPILLNAARLAPSSHNTQPWHIIIENDSFIIGYEPGRHLKVGDPEKRELFISLGCLIENINLAARDSSLAMTYKFFGEAPKRIARLSFVPTKNSTKQGWMKLIQNRRSDRKYYESKKLSAESLAMLAGLSSKKTSLVIADQLADIDFLSEMTYVSTLETMSNKAFREELASWVRNNWTKQHDGMPGYTQGMPGPISLLAKFIITRAKRVAKDQAKKDALRVKRTPAIGLICLNKQNPEQWINAGRLYQSACLMALGLGIHTSAVSAAVINTNTTRKIKNRLGLDNTPVALIRFGYSKKLPKAAPRRKVSDFTTG